MDDQYAVVWKACMVVLGINMEGKQDILSLTILQKESASGWSTMLTDLRMRGVKDILIICSDNLTGLDKAVEATFPNSVRQICIILQIRNSLKYVNYKDRRKIVKEIKSIYQSDNEEMARENFEIFKENWGKNTVYRLTLGKKTRVI